MTAQEKAVHLTANNIDSLYNNVMEQKSQFEQIQRLVDVFNNTHRFPKHKYDNKTGICCFIATNLYVRNSFLLKSKYEDDQDPTTITSYACDDNVHKRTLPDYYSLPGNTGVDYMRFIGEVRRILRYVE